MQAVGGTISFRVNGQVLRAKGDFTYNLGLPMRETVVGVDGVHGYRVVYRAAFIEGTITDRGDLDVATLQQIEGATVQLDVANGKGVVLADAHYAGEGNVSTAEGEIGVRFEGERGEELRPS